MTVETLNLTVTDGEIVLWIAHTGPIPDPLDKVTVATDSTDQIDASLTQQQIVHLNSCMLLNY